MPATPNPERSPLAFDLYNYEHDERVLEIETHIRDGGLPFDTLFRLASIGCYQRDLLEDSRKHLTWAILEDCAAHANDPEALRPDTQALLWGERPDAIIDYNSANYQAYAQLEPMYYDLADLARVIRSRRAEQGKATTEVPRGWYLTPEELETNRCFGLARPLWRVIVQRIHPEWLTRADEYCPWVTTFNQVYEPGERLKRRRIIGHAVLSDTVVLRIYSEAVETGVKGIGSAGRESLRVLLADEHPELLEGFEVPRPTAKALAE